jgi:hypothetical protein
MAARVKSTVELDELLRAKLLTDSENGKEKKALILPNLRDDAEFISNV